MRFDEKSVDSALVYLRAAIDIMGDNAELYAGMARAYGQYANIGIETEDNFKRAEEYARKAISLDPNSPGALVELASESWFGDYPQNLHDAFRYLHRAMSANPSGTTALGDIAFYYMDIGRPSQALAYVQRLERQDPLNPRWLTLRGLCFLYNCQYGQALEEFRKYYLADSTNPFGRLNYATALAYAGKRDEALSIIGRSATGDRRNVAIMFCLQLRYALLSDRENALRLITPGFRQTCWRDMEWSYYVATRLSLAGAKKEALDWLENSINRGFINYPLFQCDPFLDNIRGEARFKKLMERAKHEWEHFEVPE
jgi:tetratricopeptide (TPR) repeat protein